MAIWDIGKSKMKRKTSMLDKVIKTVIDTVLPSVPLLIGIDTLCPSPRDVEERSGVVRKTKICYSISILRHLSLLALMLVSVGLSAQVQPAVESNRAEHFDLISINHAMFIHLMEDLSYLQAHVPVQDARLDVLHQSYPYFRYGLMSGFLYETVTNPVGQGYEPQGFVSLLPMGLQVPIRGKKNWQANFYTMFYWANYIDTKSMENITFKSYLHDYPKLAEAGFEIALSALITCKAGYRQQLWKNNNENLGSFSDINPTRGYSRLFAEVNIGLQTLTHLEKTQLMQLTSAKLNIDYKDEGINILSPGDSLQIQIVVSNKGKFTAKDIRLYVTNEADLPLKAELSTLQISRLKADEELSCVLKITADSKFERPTSGNITVVAIDKQGNTADCVIPILIEPVEFTD